MAESGLSRKNAMAFTDFREQLIGTDYVILFNRMDDCFWGDRPIELGNTLPAAAYFQTAVSDLIKNFLAKANAVFLLRYKQLCGKKALSGCA